MFEPKPENPESSSSNPPEWLSALRPASASSLQASVFYQAGYEAARRELNTSVWRRASIVAIAASVLMASASGALLFQFGKQNAQTISVAKQEQPTKPFVAPMTERDPQMAFLPANDKTLVGNNQSLISQWLQLQVKQALPIAKSRALLLGQGVELGRMGDELDKIIVLNNAANTNTRTIEPKEEDRPIEPQSLRSMRDNQIKSLMKSML